MCAVLPIDCNVENTDVALSLIRKADDDDSTFRYNRIFPGCSCRLLEDLLSQRGEISRG